MKNDLITIFWKCRARESLKADHLSNLNGRCRVISLIRSRFFVFGIGRIRNPTWVFPRKLEVMILGIKAVDGYWGAPAAVSILVETDIRIKWLNPFRSLAEFPLEAALNGTQELLPQYRIELSAKNN